MFSFCITQKGAKMWTYYNVFMERRMCHDRNGNGASVSDHLTLALEQRDAINTHYLLDFWKSLRRETLAVSQAADTTISYCLAWKGYQNNNLIEWKIE